MLLSRSLEASRRIQSAPAFERLTQRRSGNWERHLINVPHSLSRQKVAACFFVLAALRSFPDRHDVSACATRALQVYQSLPYHYLDSVRDDGQRRPVVEEALTELC